MRINEFYEGGKTFLVTKRPEDYCFCFLFLTNKNIFFLSFINRLLEESDSFQNFHFQKRGQVKMKGKSEPMTTYLLQRAEKEDGSIANYPLMGMGMEGSTPSFYGSYSTLNGLGGLGGFNGYSSIGDAVLTQPLGGGEFSLNRSRAGSSFGGRRSRNASRFTTPGMSNVLIFILYPNLIL